MMSSSRTPCLDTHSGALICQRCGEILPPTEVSYFELLGLPSSFSIDLGVLEKAYSHLQLKLHPDRTKHLTPTQRMWAQLHSQKLNQAFFTLQDPLLRAEYLLQHAGPLEGPDVDTLSSLFDLSEQKREGDLSPETLADLISNQTELLAQAFSKKDLQKAAQIFFILKALKRLL